ncbi:MAG: ABC transporter permease [Vallitaleaceae bacterium]|nr:ABC transporter permease [Vallitaleaceae bacterium]
MLKEIIKKELKRVFTDRRLVISTFIIPAVSIYLIYTLMGNMAGNFVSDIQDHRSTVFVSNAPDSFKNYYKSVENNYNLVVSFGGDIQESQKADIKTNQLDLLVQFEPDFDAKVTGYMDATTTPEIKTYYNPSEEYSSAARNNVAYTLLEGYRQSILIERYGDINYIKGFDVDRDLKASEIMDEKKASSSSLGMIVPMLLAIILFAGAMGIGMDTIAGEKERGTMATLLLTPVPRETIALGKVIGLGIVAIVSSAFSFGAIIASLPNMMNTVSDGAVGSMKINFSSIQYVELFVIMIALVGIYVGLICLISVRARTVKEAGTYVAPVYMVIMVAAFSTMFTTAKNIAIYKFAIPVYGSVLAIKKMFSFDLTFQQFAVSTGVALVVTAVLIVLITKTFNDEKVMFNA